MVAAVQLQRNGGIYLCIVAAVQLQRNGIVVLLDCKSSNAVLQIQQCVVLIANPAMRGSNDSSPQSVHFRIENVLLDRLCVRVVRMDDRLNLSPR